LKYKNISEYSKRCLIFLHKFPYFQSSRKMIFENFQHYNFLKTTLICATSHQGSMAVDLKTEYFPSENYNIRMWVQLSHYEVKIFFFLLAKVVNVCWKITFFEAFKKKQIWQNRKINFARKKIMDAECVRVRGFFFFFFWGWGRFFFFFLLGGIQKKI